MKKIFSLFFCIFLCFCCFFWLFACNNKSVNNDIVINPKTRSIKVGYIEYAPLNYMYKGKFTGYNTKLAVSVFNTLGYNVEFVLVEPEDENRSVVNESDVYYALENNEIDCFWGAISDAVINDHDKFDFSYNYMENSPCIVIKNGQNHINSLEDFKTKTIAFAKFSSGELFYNAFLSNVQGINFISCEKGQNSALHKTNSFFKDVNCAIVDTIFAYYYLEKTEEYCFLTLNSTNKNPCFKMEQKNYLRVVFKKSQTEQNQLRDNVNKTLEFFAGVQQTIENEKLSLLELPAINTKFKNADLKDFLITDFSNQK